MAAVSPTKKLKLGGWSFQETSNIFSWNFGQLFNVVARRLCFPTCHSIKLSLRTLKWRRSVEIALHCGQSVQCSHLSRLDSNARHQNRVLFKAFPTIHSTVKSNTTIIWQELTFSGGSKLEQYSMLEYQTHTINRM